MAILQGRKCLHCALSCERRYQYAEGQPRKCFQAHEWVGSLSIGGVLAVAG
jgi:hypothetical protein